MSTETTVETVVPPPTKQEKALTAAQLSLAEQQLVSIAKQQEFQEQQFEAFGPLVESFEADAAAARARAEELAPIQDELLNLQLEALNRGGAATEEELGLIREATERAISAGTSDIEAFRGRSLDQLREDMEAPDIEAEIQRNFALAEILQIRGTPSFVIGDNIIRGLIDTPAMRAVVAEVRNGSS